MKKLAALISALAFIGLGSSSAHAALTTAPADNRPIYVLDQYNGNISRYNFETQDTTLVCESDFPSSYQITVSEYVPEDGLLYWVRNDDVDNATIVSINPITCEQSEAPLNWNGHGNFANTDAIGMTHESDGQLIMYLIDGNDWGNAYFAEIDPGVDEWVGSPIANDGNESQVRDIAEDLVTGEMYMIFPWCTIRQYPSWVTVADYAGQIYTDCTSLEIDSNQRWWVTSQSTGYLNSDNLNDPGSSLEVHGTDNIDPSLYGEEFFFGPTDDEIAAVQSANNNAGGSDLASTGGNMNLAGVFGAAGLFFAAAIAFAVRARRLGRQ